MSGDTVATRSHWENGSKIASVLHSACTAHGALLNVYKPLGEKVLMVSLRMCKSSPPSMNGVPPRHMLGYRRGEGPLRPRPRASLCSP